jgi:hypothetical protein
VCAVHVKPLVKKLGGRIPVSIFCVQRDLANATFEGVRPVTPISVGHVTLNPPGRLADDESWDPTGTFQADYFSRIQ